MFARIIEWSITEQVPGPADDGLPDLRRDLLAAADAAGCDPGPLRRPGDHLHRVSRPGAADRRGPGHLSAHDADAGGAVCQGGARLLVLRLLVRLHHLRGRDGHVLGAQPRARVSELRLGPPAERRHADAWAGRHRRGLGLHVRAQVGPARPGGAAKPPGLVPEVRADERPGRFRGRQHRRLRPAVPDHRRSRTSCAATTSRSRRSGRRSSAATTTSAGGCWRWPRRSS